MWLVMVTIEFVFLSVIGRSFPCMASPRICQILLGKFCVLLTSKKICQVKKRVHLQQFGIIHLSNTDPTYIRNPERNKIMFVPFHLLKTYLRKKTFSNLYFFTLPPAGKRRWQSRSACAYMRMERWVLRSFYLCLFGLPNCWRPIFLVLPKLNGCQVGPPNSWSCLVE
jgi:hypothetical protein